MSNTCNDCRFFRPHSYSNSSGQCCESPPVVVGTHHTILSRRPSVEQDDPACVEFEASYDEGPILDYLDRHRSDLPTSVSFDLESEQLTPNPDGTLDRDKLMAALVEQLEKSGHTLFGGPPGIIVPKKRGDDHSGE